MLFERFYLPVYSNVIVAFASVILRPTDESTIEMIQDADVVNEIVSLFIENFEYVLEDAEHDFISIGKANFDYAGTTESELTFNREDIIFVVKEDTTGWWEGEVNGLYGFFPSNYAEIICPLPTAANLALLASQNAEQECEEEEEVTVTSENPAETKTPATDAVTKSDTNPPAGAPARSKAGVARPESTIGGTSKKDFLQQMNDIKKELQQSAEIRERLEALVQSLSGSLHAIRQGGNTTSSDSPQEAALRGEVQKVKTEITHLTKENQSLHTRIKEAQTSVASTQKAIELQKTENSKLAQEIKETQDTVVSISSSAKPSGPSSRPVVAAVGAKPVSPGSGDVKIPSQPPGKRRAPPSRVSPTGPSTKPSISRAATSNTIPAKPAPKLATTASVSNLPPAKPTAPLATMPSKPGAPSTRPASTRPSRFAKPKPPGSGTPRLTGT